MSPGLRCVPGCAPAPEVGTAGPPQDGAEAYGSGRDPGTS